MILILIPLAMMIAIITSFWPERDIEKLVFLFWVWYKLAFCVKKEKFHLPCV